MADNSVLVFTPSARRAQAKRGSAKAYERKTSAGFPDRSDPGARGVPDRRIDTAFLGTVWRPARPISSTAARSAQGLHQGGG